MKSNILLLSGWGSTCDVWSSIIPALDDRYHINCVTPAWVSNNVLTASMRNFDHYIEALAASLRYSTYVVAWSLGGLIAIRLAAMFPTLVNKIIFIASAPQFVKPESGIDPTWFRQFQMDFKHRPETVLKKFLTLQTKGDEFAKSTLLRLRDILNINTYDLDECGFALSLLADLDLTRDLKSVACESAFIHGECDAVLPIAAGYNAANLCQARFYPLPAVGHVPHVSHPQQVSGLILDNLH